MTIAIETKGLVKSFGSNKALDGINLSIRRGSVYGLLGPNGAGKTTTVRVLSTLLKPSSGTALVLGHDVAREASTVRQKVSLTGQYASVDEDLTGMENLVLISRLLGLSWRDSKARASELLEAFGLSDAAGRQVQTYSGGMRRRIDIAASLVTKPEILFLDEPTTGLDPRSRNQVWELVKEIAAAGTTVLLTTQYLEEADRLAERMAVIDHGRVIAEGTSQELKASVGVNTLQLRVAKVEQSASAHSIISGLIKDLSLVDGDPAVLSVKVPNASTASGILAALSSSRIEVADFSLAAPSLDDVFFSLTGHAAADKVQTEGAKA